MKRRIVFSVLVAAIVFIVAFAVICPAMNLKKLEAEGECVARVLPHTGTVITAGTVAENGDVTVTEQTPCVVEYEIAAQSVRCVKIDFREKMKEDKSFAVENTVDGTFTDRAAAYANIRQGDNSVCIELDEGEYKAIRIWYLENCNVENILLYNMPPKTVGIPLDIEPWRYVLTAVVTAIAFVVAFLLDKFFSIYKRLYKFIERKKSRIILFALGVFGALATAAVAELIFRALFGADSVGNRFNAASFGIFASITVICFIFCFERKNIALKPEKAVAFIILTAGFLIIFTEPFSHNSSDEDSHYYWAVQNSFYKEAHLSDSDYCVRHTIDFSLANGHSLESSLEKVSIMNGRDELSTYKTEVSNSLPHRLAGAFIAIARLFGASFRAKFICGQVANLLIYAATVYFAIKKLKSGKMIMSVIALFPTNILLASNYSYDAWVTGFSLLGIAYFISELEQPEKPITVWETAIMCGALMLAALPKQIYVVLMFIPMFIRKQWIDKQQKRRYFMVLFAFFALMFTLFIVRSVSSVTGSGDTRGGDVEPMGQFMYILTNPFEYAVILIKFLAEYLSPLNAKEYITFFSYLGDGKSAIVFVLVLLFCTVTDKNANNRFKGYNSIRVIVILFDFVLVCMIATALYIAFTPVAYETINGCNPRYLIPLLAPLALTVGNPGIKLKKNKAVYNFSVLAIITVCLIFDILTVITVPML